MTDLPAPPFKNLMEIRLHGQKDSEFRHWLRSRLLEMKVHPINWVTGFYVYEDRIHVDYDDGSQYVSSCEIDFTWDELMGASNDTYRKAQEEKARKERERREAADLQSRKDAVKNLEKALENARRKLEET